MTTGGAYAPRSHTSLIGAPWRNRNATACNTVMNRGSTDRGFLNPPFPVRQVPLKDLKRAFFTIPARLFWP
jgi:hypothetical protein